MLPENGKQNSTHVVDDSSGHADRQASATLQVRRVIMSPDLYDDASLVEPVRGSRQPEIQLPTFIEIV